MRAMVLVVMLAAVIAHAATVGGTANVNWTAPATYNDGSPLPLGAITGYNVYVGAATRTYDRVIKVPASVTTAAIPISVEGRIYVAITAVTAVPVDPGSPPESRESDYSNEVTRGITVVDVVPSAPPTGVTINIAVTCTPTSTAGVTCKVKVTQ